MKKIGDRILDAVANRGDGPKDEPKDEPATNQEDLMDLVHRIYRFCF
jgi:hypothetical protein